MSLGKFKVMMRPTDGSRMTMDGCASDDVLFALSIIVTWLDAPPRKEPVKPEVRRAERALHTFLGEMKRYRASTIERLAKSKAKT